MGEQARTYTLAEVLAGGFEARCDLLNGTRYLWHGTEGIRVDPQLGVSSWICDPSALPEGDWRPTVYGELELAEGDAGE